MKLTNGVRLALGAIGVSLLAAGCDSAVPNNPQYQAELEIQSAANSVYNALAAGDLEKYNKNICPEKVVHDSVPDAIAFMRQFKQLELVNSAARDVDLSANKATVTVTFKYKDRPNEELSEKRDASKFGNEWKIC